MKIQDKSRFKKRFSNQVPSKFPKACDDRVSKPNSQKGRFTTSPSKNPNVVSDILQVFSLNAYALVDSGATLSFVTPLVARNFDILPDILNKPFR